MFYIIQAAALVAAYLSAFEEVAFTWPFREIHFYADIEKSDKKKKELSRTFHRFGAAEVFVFIAAASSSSFFIYHSWGQRILHFFIWGAAAGIIYANVFNISYANRIGQDWFYLGGSAESDKWILKNLGKRAGEWLLFVSLLVITYLNFIN